MNTLKTHASKPAAAFTRIVVAMALLLGLALVSPPADAQSIAAPRDALSQPSAAESIDQPEIQDQAKFQAELQKAGEAMAATKREKFQAEGMRRIFELIRPSALGSSLGH